jgi:Flp pilus assembly protein TadG
MIGRLARTLAALRGESRGATLVEFAIVAPVMCLLFVGAFDVGHTLYMRTVLQGIMQKAARDSGLETGVDNQAVIDTKVRNQVLAVHNKANLQFSRRYYRTFSQAALAKAEPFTDTNKNNKCDKGEPYEDTNNNRVRDLDGADEGQGGAKDSVLYTVTVTYPRMMPLNTWIGVADDNVVKGTMVLANQPFGDQGADVPTVRYCP